jgi:adenylate cyclase
MDKIQQHKIQITIIFAIFLLYFLNGIGALDISSRSGFGLNFNYPLLSAVLSNTLAHPLQPQSLNLAFMLLTGLVLSIMLPIVTPLIAALITVAVCIPHILISVAIHTTPLIFPIEYSLLTIVILFSINALLIYFIETHSRQKIIQVFGQYVPPDVVKIISKQPDKLNMESESKRLTVFFSDMQNFANVAEQLNPKQLSMLLNEYFNEMTEILYRHGATIDKYIGDSIMAFWGAPLEQEDHAQRAVLSTLDMHQAIKKLSKNFIKRGWPGPVMGIGINTGFMNVGNMGSKYRVAYTVVGDAVNLASRIEALTRHYNVRTLVTESTKNDCKGIAFREIDTVQVKGKYNTTRIYEPLCRTPDLTALMDARLKLHQEAMEYYANQHFNSAAKIFRQLHETDRNDGLYPVLLGIVSKQSSSEEQTEHD